METLADKLDIYSKKKI